MGIQSLGLEKRGKKKKREEEGSRGNEKRRVERKKKEEIEIKLGEKVRVIGVKLTARISNLIKIKATFFLFVPGEKLPFTRITDTVKFHNFAIKLLSHFYDIRVDFQQKAQRKPTKTRRKEKKNTPD